MKAKSPQKRKKARKPLVADQDANALSQADLGHYETAKRIPADVLLLAGQFQADNCMMSEDFCLRMMSGWEKAAQRAKARRTDPGAPRRPRNFSILGHFAANDD